MGSADIDGANRSTQLLTVEEVASHYRTTVRTVQRWIREGKLRAIQLPSGRYRISQADLDAAMGTEASA